MTCERMDIESIEPGCIPSKYNKEQLQTFTIYNYLMLHVFDKRTQRIRRAEQNVTRSSVEYPCERSKVHSPKRPDKFETYLKIKRKQKEQRFGIHEITESSINYTRGKYDLFSS